MDLDSIVKFDLMEVEEKSTDSTGIHVLLLSLCTRVFYSPGVLTSNWWRECVPGSVSVFFAYDDIVYFNFYLTAMNDFEFRQRFRMSRYAFGQFLTLLESAQCAHVSLRNTLRGRPFKSDMGYMFAAFLFYTSRVTSAMDCADHIGLKPVYRNSNAFHFDIVLRSIIYYINAMLYYTIYYAILYSTMVYYKD